MDDASPTDRTDKTLFDAKAVWSAFVACGEAALALREARDMVLAGTGNTLAASTLFVLAEATAALVREMGAEVRALHQSADPEVRGFIARVLEHLHAPPERATVPPAHDPEAPR